MWNVASSSYKRATTAQFPRLNLKSTGILAGMLLQHGCCVGGSGVPFPNHGHPSGSPTSTMTSGHTYGLSNTNSVTSGVVQAINIHKVMLVRFYQALFTLPATHACLYLQELRGLEWSSSLQEPSAWHQRHSSPSTSTCKTSTHSFTGHVKCDVADCHHESRLPIMVRTKE